MGCLRCAIWKGSSPRIWGRPGTIDPTSRLLQQAGLRATVCGAFGPSRDLSSEITDVRENGIAYLSRRVEIAKTLGSRTVVGPDVFGARQDAYAGVARAGEAMGPRGREPPEGGRLRRRSGASRWEPSRSIGSRRISSTRSIRGCG